jgi:hypothetical protein
LTSSYHIEEPIMLESHSTSSRQIALAHFACKIVFAKPALFSNLVLTKELFLKSAPVCFLAFINSTSAYLKYLILVSLSKHQYKQMNTLCNYIQGFSGRHYSPII